MGLRRPAIYLPRRLSTHQQPPVYSAEIDSKGRMLVFFVLLHAPLGLLFYYIPTLSIIWGYLIIAVGISSALLRATHSIVPLAICAYLVGGEMMWRLLEVRPVLPYEIGRYTLFLIISIGIFRRYRNIGDMPIIPFLFLLCLLPSMVIWLGEKDLTFARKALFGTLLPPILLAMGAIYLYKRSLSAEALRYISFIAIAPTVSVAAIATYNTWLYAASDQIFFGQSSNPITSGGVGPNQVSNTLAFGALWCWYVFVHLQVPQATRFLFIGIAIWLIGQALLTFSRGGVITAIVSIAASVFVSILEPKQSAILRIRNVIGITVLLITSVFIILPWLNDFTSNRLTERYDIAATGTSGRYEIALAEIDMWQGSPIFGIGPGNVRSETENYLAFGANSHTEFTRLLAEHGVFGLFAVILFSVGLLRNLVRAQDVRARSWIAGLGAFSVFFMGQAATRTIAPIVAYMLIWAQLFSDSES